MKTIRTIRHLSKISVTGGFVLLASVCGCVIDQRSSESGSYVSKAYYDELHDRIKKKMHVSKQELVEKLGQARVIDISKTSEWWEYEAVKSDQNDMWGLFGSLHIESRSPSIFRAEVEKEANGGVVNVWLCDARAAQLANSPCAQCDNVVIAKAEAAKKDAQDAEKKATAAASAELIARKQATLALDMQQQNLALLNDRLKRIGQESRQLDERLRFINEMQVDLENLAEILAANASKSKTPF